MIEYENSKSDDQLEELLLLTEQMQEKPTKKKYESDIEIIDLNDL